MLGYMCDDSSLVKSKKVNDIKKTVICFVIKLVRSKDKIIESRYPLFDLVFSLNYL